MARVSRHWNVRMCWSYHGLRWKTHRNPWPSLVRIRLVERDGGGCTFRWTSDIHTGFCQQNLEDKYDSIQWYARFGRFTFWQYHLFYFLLPGSVFLEWFLFSGNENLTIVNWCDFKMFLHSPIQFNVQVCCVMRDGSGIHFLGPNKMPLATRQMLFQWFGLKETSACFGVAKKDQPTAKGCTVYADLTNLRHWKLTWNLKIICLKSKSQLPSTIFWVPRYRLGVGTPTKNTPDFGRSKKPSTKRPKEKDLIQKDQFFATDLAPLGSCAFWYHKVEFYITKDGVFINIVKG